jgi:Tfp pilus assembly protein PilZ
LIAYQTAVAIVYFSYVGNKLFHFFFALAALILFIYIVGKLVRVPYFFPKIRWWESDPRYKLSVPAKIFHSKGSALDGEIMDLSIGGCFIKSNESLALEENVKIEFSLFEQKYFCEGVVVWQTASTVTHPKGIGVKFKLHEKVLLNHLKIATKKLKTLSKTYSELTRERNWQEYLQREQRYQGKK